MMHDPFGHKGLSPHTRGNRAAPHSPESPPGSIPAHTGEPSGTCQRPCSARVYPRTHGGTMAPDRIDPPAEGLSPHTRGNRPAAGRGRYRAGSIPAHTGEPPISASGDPPIRVYPRTHGGTLYSAVWTSMIWGLSPHTRGNLRSARGISSGPGSIPAHTGEPPCILLCEITRRVYPRTHGGTSGSRRGSRRTRGLSPHTRGNHCGSRRRTAWSRSIPAHTGEPSWMTRRRRRSGVYPRTHGGTSSTGLRSVAFWGLSPHTRGNPTGAGGGAGGAGSIPAHTGEPAYRTPLNGYARVYPRTHGGTASGRPVPQFVQGLSPHTRGNRWPMPVCGNCPGSIPAHTGEPAGAHQGASGSRVYPRTHGGTNQAALADMAYQGLSPHTRGNQPFFAVGEIGIGSIPAHTGEPRISWEPRRRSGVYPRTHGGTWLRSCQRDQAKGLSPHTRGNRGDPDPVGTVAGSIPAHTGEPSPPSRPTRSNGVCPRTHGGTPGIERLSALDEGLSPHTRGNLHGQPERPPVQGSIPAHTGEPGRSAAGS